MYDTESQSTNSVDANGVVVSVTYDDVGRLRPRTFPDAGVEGFGYTANVSGPTSYTNQISKVTTWLYDAAGRKTNEVIVGVMTR
jgi:YD repeat-containing protein